MRRTGVFVVSGLIAVLLSVTACSSGSKNAAGGPASTVGSLSSPVTPAAAGAATDPASATAAASAPAAASGSGGAGVDVCGLMSSAQASSINSVTYGATKSQHARAGFDVCTYTNTGKHVSPIDIQDLTVEVVSIAGCYTELQSADGPGKNVAGIGDAAFGYSIGIVVKDGDRCVDISGLTFAELQNNYAPDTAMAKIILGNLH
jgi:hypothetical protein